MRRSPLSGVARTVSERHSPLPVPLRTRRSGVLTAGVYAITEPSRPAATTPEDDGEEGDPGDPGDPGNPGDPGANGGAPGRPGRPGSPGAPPHRPPPTVPEEPPHYPPDIRPPAAARAPGDVNTIPLHSGARSTTQDVPSVTGRASGLSVRVNSADAKTLSRTPRERNCVNPEVVFDYSARHTTPLPSTPLLEQLSAQTARRFPVGAHMMVGPYSGAVLSMLVALARPSRVLELGCFTGYSALCIADALPADGTLVTCEKDHDVAAFARSFLHQTQHADKISVRDGPAMDTLRSLASNREKPFDMVFLDADKAGYVAYFDFLMGSGLLPVGGTIVADNVLFRGLVCEDAPSDQPAPAAHGPPGAAPNQHTETTARWARAVDAMRAFNRHVLADARVVTVVLPVGDGISVIRRVR